MKKMKLEEVKEFLETRVEGKTVDSFAGLVNVLEQIPGVYAAYIHTIDAAPLTRDQEGLKNNLLTIVAAIFEGDPKAESVTLHVEYPWLSNYDYTIGIQLGEKFLPIANGLFSPIVKAVA